MGRIGSVFSWARQLVTWLLLLGTTAILVVSVLLPRVAGATPYAVLTGSMSPDLAPGTLVVVKPVDEDAIGIGSVITYQLESGKPTVVTHRVVSVGVNGKGERLFTTQGDANGVPDQEPVRAVQVRGELWYSVPYLGYVNNVITGKERQVVLIGVVSFLFLYAAYMFTSALWDRRSVRGRHREGVSA